jgi:hypothetical protein
MFRRKHHRPPNQPFSHTDDCRIVKADPSFEPRGTRSTAVIGFGPASAVRSITANTASTSRLPIADGSQSSPACRSM